MNEITLVLISYKSENKIYKFIEKTPKDLKIIIIENSNNKDFKKSIENKYKNISVYVKENDGVSSSLNFAIKYIKTKYFLQISPDIDFNFKELKFFLDLAKNLGDDFAAIGPRFEGVKKKSHKQIKKNLEYGAINSIHGSCMFINKKNCNDIGGFDDNFFLYFEETEFCYRAKKKGFLSYQINKSKVVSNGRSVEITDQKEERRISNILIWHFIWSKFYFNKLKYGKFISILIFLPLLVRIIIKLFFYITTNDNKKIEKYKFRLRGLINSILEKKSSLRP
jgi:GT2 family glycosyltransferase